MAFENKWEMVHFSHKEEIITRSPRDRNRLKENLQRDIDKGKRKH